jgi:hypothetical protein
MMQSDPYFLGYRQAELARLQHQAEDLAPESNWLFDQLGLPLGARVIEIGCGPRGVSICWRSASGDRARS